MADAKDIKAKYRFMRIRVPMTGKKMAWPPEKDPKEVSKNSGSGRIVFKTKGTKADPFNLSLTRKRIKRHMKTHNDLMANRSIQAHKDAAIYNAYRAEKGMKPHEA